MSWDYRLDPETDNLWIRVAERVEDYSDKEVIEIAERRCPGSYDRAIDELRSALIDTLYDEEKYGAE